MLRSLIVCGFHFPDGNLTACDLKIGFKSYEKKKQNKKKHCSIIMYMSRGINIIQNGNCVVLTLCNGTMVIFFFKKELLCLSIHM